MDTQAVNTFAIEADHALWQSLRTRRRRRPILQGWDGRAARWQARLQHQRRNMGYLRQQAQAADAVAPTWRELGEAALNTKIGDIRAALARGRDDPALTVDTLAAVREAARRETGQQAYVVQLMGALGLFHGQIVEMLTGEGKTLTGSLAAAMLAWRHRHVHVITVNDYLAQRDAESRNPIYKRCGVAAAAITAQTEPDQRYTAYRRQVVYVTQKELVADWLRDQIRLGRITDPVAMRWRSGGDRPPQVLVPGLQAALVDEADAVLIDEAVTPLIIAQDRGDEAQEAMYRRARELAVSLVQREHFQLEHRKRRANLTRAGSALITDKITDDDHAIWLSRRRRDELVEQALVAEHFYRHGEQYQIIDDKVTIVDEYTGRFMEDRQWQHGLHQAVEAKHNEIDITGDRDTLASMSFQRFFRLYPHLCGMTGTAADALQEMETTYRLPVREIPTHRPVIREQWPTLIYADEQIKWQAVVDEIVELHALGRPVLAGTRSVAASEILSRMLDAKGLKHEVLNATNHEHEAAIIANAGERNAITVATNMAGRGTDISLGTGVQKLGGLHVILTEMHTARRIDRQFVGRAGRQGDPGSARVILCLEDDLITKHATRLGPIVRKRYANRTDPLPATLLRLFNRCQRKAQKEAFRSRHSVLRRDEDLDRALPG